MQNIKLKTNNIAEKKEYMITEEQNKYEQALSLYPTDINDEEVKAQVARIMEEKVPQNNTEAVKRFLLGSVELTSLKATDNDESILKLTEKVNAFDNDYPTLPHVATICVYPCFAGIVSESLEVDGVEVACVSGNFPSSQALLDVKAKYGKNALLRGISYREKATGRIRNLLIGGHKGGVQ